MKHAIHKGDKTSLIEINGSMIVPTYISIGEGVEYNINENVIHIRNMEQEDLKKINDMNELYMILRICMYRNTYEHDRRVKKFNRGSFQDIRKNIIEKIREYDATGNDECKRIYEDFLIEWFHLISKKDGEYYDRYR